MTLKSIAAFAVAAAMATASPVMAQQVTVKGPGGRTAAVTMADIRAMHQASVTTAWGKHATYTGALLTDLLAEVGAPSDVRLHGPPVNQIVVVTGDDAFTTVLSLAETEASFRKEPVILAYQVNGEMLAGKEAPYRLVVGGELKQARSVYGVIEIELRPVK
jgi:DMSO/TMAO reductase YedYZ molybdopterin-dependent catalytic subunit